MCLHGRVGIQLGFDGLIGVGPMRRAGSVQLAGRMTSTKAWGGEQELAD